MKSPDSQPNNFTPDVIRGKNFSIIIPGPESVGQFLDSPNDSGGELLSVTDDRLPVPIQKMWMYAYAASYEGDLPGISASIRIEPSDMLEEKTKTWHSDLLTALDSDLLSSCNDTVRADHEFNAIYSIIDDHTAVRIALNSSTISCRVDLKLVHVDDLEHELGLKLSAPASKQDQKSSYESLLNFTAILTTCADTVVDQMGETTPEDDDERPITFLEITVPRKKVVNRIGQIANSLEPFLSNRLANPQLAIESAPKKSETKTFDDLGGMHLAKERLQAIAAYYDDPASAERYGVKPSHFLLHGPPGVGKTALAETFADEIDAEIRIIKSSDVIDKYVGQSGKNITEIFKQAFADDKRKVLFFDEFDAMTGSKDSRSDAHAESRKLFQQYVTEASREHPNIVICAATNRDIDDLEPSIVRSGRLEPISVSMPNQSERQEIWSIVIFKAFTKNDIDMDHIELSSEELSDKYFSLFDESVDTKELADLTDGMSGADFEKIIDVARNRCFSQFRKTGQDQQISQTILRDVIISFHRR